MSVCKKRPVNKIADPLAGKTKKDLQAILDSRGFTKEKFYTFHPSSIQELKDRVRATDPHMFTTVALSQIARITRCSEPLISDVFAGKTEFHYPVTTRDLEVAQKYRVMFNACPENWTIWRNDWLS